MKKLFSSQPISLNLATLVLRLTASLIAVHGWNKLMNFSEKANDFPDPLHVGHKLSLVLTIFAELFCTGFITLGIFTRISLIAPIICMLVIIFIVDEGQPWMESESAINYLFIYVTLLCTGAGKYSLDSILRKGK